jgi:hypothetical protein
VRETRSTQGGIRNAYKILCKTLKEGDRLRDLGTDVQVILLHFCENYVVEWIKVVQRRAQWWAFVKSVIPTGSIKVGNSLICHVTSKFSRTVL